ncbi:MAG: cysteine desulfurase [Thermoanaerobaculia bacterium]
MSILKEVPQTAPEIRRLDIERVRRDFPALELRVRGKPLVYLDSAASAQKPVAVLEAVERCYREYYSNVHRGAHYLSHKATEAYEGARGKVQRFLNAPSPREIIFLRGTTEGINLVAASYGRTHVGEGDEVLITAMEHHSNIVPWQLLCEEKGARLRVAPIDDRGDVLLEEFERLLSRRTRMVSIAHVSNALGTVNPVREMTEMAHARGVPVLIDGAQAVPHFRVDVQELGCDFYAFSSHKLFGPTGIGALWGRYELLEAMPPYQGGGEMIRSVTFEKTEYAEPPARFEAGTPNIAGAVGLGAAIDYLDSFDPEAVARHERELLAYATEAVSAVSGVRLIGTAREKASVVSFVIEGVHAHDVGTVLDSEGVAVRAGHHCAQPVMQRYGVPATARASFVLYNTLEEVDRLTAALAKVHQVFG